MNKYKTYIVYVCHIKTTSSKHLSDLIVKKIPKALELFVFFLTVLRYQTYMYYTCSFKSCIILFSSAKKKKKNGYCLRSSYNTALLLTLS